MIRSGIAGLGLLLSASQTMAEECAPISWGSVTAGDLVIAKGSIIVGVDIEGVGKNLPLQLDTGSATTELYGEAVPSAVLAAGTQARSVAVSGWTGAGKPLQVAVRPPAGPRGQTAGTIGTDALSGGFVVDLEHQRICRLSVLKGQEISNWQPLTLANGSPVIEASESGVPIRLLLDTGSSGFTLLSTPALSATVRTATLLRQLKVPSFGRMLTVSERKPSAEVTVMGKPLALDTVYALEDPDVEGMLKSAGIAGLLGVRPFTDGALAFDFPGKRVGFGRLPK